MYYFITRKETRCTTKFISCHRVRAFRVQSYIIDPLYLVGLVPEDFDHELVHYHCLIFYALYFTLRDCGREYNRRVWVCHGRCVVDPYRCMTVHICTGTASNERWDLWSQVAASTCTILLLHFLIQCHLVACWCKRTICSSLIRFDFFSLICCNYCCII